MEACGLHTSWITINLCRQIVTGLRAFEVGGKNFLWIIYRKQETLMTSLGKPNIYKITCLM